MDNRTSIDTSALTTSVILVGLFMMLAFALIVGGLFLTARVIPSLAQDELGLRVLLAIVNILSMASGYVAVATAARLTGYAKKR